MKAIFSFRKHRYLRSVSIFLIAAVLIGGVVSCNGAAVQYDLVIDSTAGGVVTGPGEGTFTYDDGTVVDLVATPDCGYAFAGWTGDTGDIDDVNVAATNITMNADYSINANFEPLPPDHYKFYYVNELTAPNPGEVVELVDQFGTLTATVTEAIIFGNPVDKIHNDTLTPIADDNRHYTVYWLDYNYEEYYVKRSVEVSNQFSDAAEPQTLTVEGPIALAVPTKKEGHEMVECLNHYLLYWAYYEEEFPEVGVNLKDQFIPDGEDVVVWAPKLFANPVQKTVVESGDVAEIEDADLHWVLYDIWDEEALSIEKNGLQIDNQFGPQALDLTYRDTLAVPSQKIVPPTPPLDHFKCYPAEGPGLVEVYTYLEDQFGSYESVPVFAPWFFCNSVDKVHGTLTTDSNPDNHLTVYSIETTPHWWTVTVDNQFGNNQELVVVGPIGLAVPTQKLEPYYHEKPKYLDHYLLYAVTEGLNVTATVGLDDQFPGTAAIVEVTEPIFFATPAIKGHLDYEPGFWDPEGHLVFYAISDNDEYVSSVVINNQFHEATLLLDDFDELLAVPSVKVSYGPVL
jgi:hypothetical protein